MDLSSYGLNYVLPENTGKVLYADFNKMPRDKISPIAYDSQNLTLKFTSGTYKLGKLLGRGTYGHVYEATDIITNKVYAVKAQDVRKSSYVHDIIVEAIIHILLYDTSRNQINGPYVPIFYEIGYIPNNNIFGVPVIISRMELLTNSIHDYIKYTETIDINFTISTMLIQVANILDFFHKTFKMNHRDLKSNNIMYVMDEAGNMHIRLIDFGLSCLTYNGVFYSLRDSFYSGEHSRCDHEGRDLTFLIIITLIEYRKYLSPELKNILRDLITFNARGRQCIIDNNFCPELGVMKFDDVYTFLNSANVVNKKATPTIVKYKMIEYLMNKGKIQGAFFNAMKEADPPYIRQTRKNTVRNKHNTRKNTAQKRGVFNIFKRGFGSRKIRVV